MSTKTHKRQTARQILKTAKSQKMLAGNWEVVATLNSGHQCLAYLVPGNSEFDYQMALRNEHGLVATLELSAEDAELLETLELTCEREMEGHHYDK